MASKQSVNKNSLHPASSIGQQIYSDLFEMSPNGIVIEDESGNILDVNSAFCELMLYKHEELIGQKIHIVTHPDVENQVDSHIDNLLKGKSLYHVEKSLRKDGSECYVRLSEQKIKLPDGKDGILSIAEDITQKLDADSSLIQKSQELENLLSTAKHLTQSLNIKDVLNKIASGAMEILNASSFGVYLLEQDGETLNPVVVVDPEYKEELLATKIQVKNSLTGKSVLAKKGLIFNDIGSEQDRYQIPGTPEEFEEKIIAVPFIVEEKVLGAIIISRMGTNFTEEELALTETYATYASAALKNAQLYNSLQQEVEERKQAQKTTYELNLQYESFIQNSLVGIWKLGFTEKIRTNLTSHKLAEKIFYKGIFTDCNDAFAQMYSYNSKDDIIGTNNSEQSIDHEVSIDRIEKFVKNNFKTEIIDSQETDKDGNVKHFRNSYFGILDGGYLKWVWGIQIEITEQKRLEAQLFQSQKMEAVGTLAGGISHDFNNFLTVINGYAQISLKRLEDSDPLYRYISTILNAGKKAEDLTRQLLAFSRKQIFQAKVIDLNSLITGLEHMLRRFISEDIEMEMMLSPKNPAIKADPGQIEQIFMNLVVNARDAIHQGTEGLKEKKITIETDQTYLDEKYVKNHPGSKTGKYVYIAVSDTGIGINEEIKEKIFEPFFTTKDKSQGTGLGLATVYGIVKQNNGSIYVYSERDYGTTFKIYWPISDDSQIIDEQEKYTKTEVSGTETILLAEDEKEVRGFASTALQNLGYTVYEAENGKQALEFIKTHNRRSKIKIDLLVTDMVMPEMNGKELASKINEIYPDTKIIYTSGYTDNHIVKSGNLDKGINFIQKPFSEQTLAKKIRNVLDKS
jgi:PAS domain S-box-containing protein